LRARNFAEVEKFAKDNFKSVPDFDAMSAEKKDLDSNSKCNFV